MRKLRPSQWTLLAGAFLAVVVVGGSGLAAAIFDKHGLESVAKTSGSKGIQLFAPLNTAVTYSDTGPFAHAVAEGDLDADATRSNTFTMEWPPRSGVQREFPEVDRAAWFGLDEAREKLNPAQAKLLERL